MFVQIEAAILVFLVAIPALASEAWLDRHQLLYNFACRLAWGRTGAQQTAGPRREGPTCGACAGMRARCFRASALPRRGVLAACANQPPAQPVQATTSSTAWRTHCSSSQPRGGCAL